MKKRLFALLLAGLLTASMISCSRSSSGKTNTVGGGENTLDLPSSSGNNQDDPIDNPSDSFRPVDLTVYTIEETPLYAEPNTESEQVEASIPALTELHTTKKSVYWYYVELADGKVGYVPAADLTEVDLFAKTFVEIDGGKTLYVSNADGLNVRLYPCTDTTLELSTIQGSYDFNDEVKAVAVSPDGDWYQIKYDDNGTEKLYFVSASLLSEFPTIDYTDESLWAEHFTELSEPQTCYINSAKVNLRKAPSEDKSVSKVTLTLDTEVTVYKTGSFEGREWSYVKAWYKGDTGEGGRWEYGYVASEMLADSLSGAHTDLDDLIKMYPELTELDAEITLYTMGSVNIRTAPDSTNDGNIETTLVKATPVSVVATGMYNGTTWAVISHAVNADDDPAYYFISYAWLTTDSAGNPVVTLEGLITKYPQFKACAEVPATVAAETANYYAAPDFSTKAEGTLELGDTVTLVATEQGDEAIWWIIKTAEGNLYFINRSLF